MLNIQCYEGRAVAEVSSCGYLPESGGGASHCGRIVHGVAKQVNESNELRGRCFIGEGGGVYAEARSGKGTMDDERTGQVRTGRFLLDGGHAEIT